MTRNRVRQVWPKPKWFEGIVAESDGYGETCATDGSHSNISPFQGNGDSLVWKEILPIIQQFASWCPTPSNGSTYIAHFFSLVLSTMEPMDAKQKEKRSFSLVVTRTMLGRMSLHTSHSFACHYC